MGLTVSEKQSNYMVSRPCVKPNRNRNLEIHFSSHSIHQPLQHAAQWTVQPLLFPNPFLWSCVWLPLWNETAS